MQQSNKLRNYLTNPQHKRVLEIVGLSSRPLSSYEIAKKYSKIHNRYIYEIIKDLAKIEIENLGQRHAERFLKISQMVSSKSRERRVELNKKNFEIIKRNFRYFLNFKGFLLYLLAAHNTIQINEKTINSMIKNLSNHQGFEFLEYFNIFDSNSRVDLLIEIAVELQFQLKTLTKEYLLHYIKRRLYSEISQNIAVKSHRILDTINFLGSKNKNEELERQNKELESARHYSIYKITLLNDLIAEQMSTLENMMIDRMKTKQLISRES